VIVWLVISADVRAQLLVSARHKVEQLGASVHGIDGNGFTVQNQQRQLNLSGPCSNAIDRGESFRSPPRRNLSVNERIFAIRLDDVRIARQGLVVDAERERKCWSVSRKNPGQHYQKRLRRSGWPQRMTTHDQAVEALGIEQHEIGDDKTAKTV